MDTKNCNGCNKIKPVSEFGKEARSGLGIKPRCKDCCNAYYNSQYEKFKTNKSGQQKQYYAKNREVIKKRVQNYSAANAEKKKAYSKSYNQLNAAKISAQKLQYIKNRIKTDSSFRAERALRAFIYRMKTEKRFRTAKILGYTVNDFKNHIGRLPERHESIDHKIPVSWFIPGTPAHIIHHLENLQIKTRSENSKKSNKKADPVSGSYINLSTQFIQPNKTHLIQNL